MKKIFVCILSCLMLQSCTKKIQDNANVLDDINCECSNPPTGKLLWDYPAKPGMNEWKQFNSNEEMVKACQIPEKILSSLSTKDLTAICLQYPLLSDVFAFNFLSMGADKLYDDFNGIRELFKRKDAWKELLKHYNCQMQVFEGVKSFLPVWNLEFLLGFYTQKADILSKEDYKKMLQSLLCGYEKEIMHDDPNFSYPFPCNFWARAHVIIKISPKSIEEMPGKKVFDGLFHRDYMDIINDLSYQLIK